jgi:hypothetical protein
LLDGIFCKVPEGNEIRLFENQGFERESGPNVAEHYVSVTDLLR